jgi:hypothetical protein
MRLRYPVVGQPHELAGTSWDVLSTVFDDLSEEDLRDAVRRLETR